MTDKYYLRLARAGDLKNKRERAFYRLLEILPGLLSCSTIIAAIVFSYFKPAWVAFFALILVAHWLFRATYFSFYLRASYRRMKKVEKINWMQKLENLQRVPDELPAKNWKDIYHVVVLPMYKEPYGVVKDSMQALLNTDYPKEKFIVILAQEERGGQEIKEMGEKIEQEFGDKFFKFIVTTHPFGLPGEIAAKSSNEAWASRKAKKLTDELGIAYENVIFTSFDIDSVASKQYFSILTYHYLTTKKPLRTSFQPIPLFLNNIWQVPALSRLFSFSTSFWHITNQQREHKLITFSSHSMPFKALVEVGFKQPDVVSDDSRIFWQCLLFYNGDYRVESLYCSISMDANVGKTFFGTLANMYKQQRRWAWGVSEIPYFVFGFWKDKKITLKKKLSLGIEVIEGHWNWACAPILLAILGWLPTVLGSDEFNQTIFSYNLPRYIGRLLTFAMLGLFGYMYYTFYLLPPKDDSKKGKIKVLIACAQWIFFPITMVFFVAAPALDAQLRLAFGKYMGFWPTPKHR